MFNFVQAAINSPEKRLERQRAYEIAASELEAGNKNKGLWAKALADSDFQDRQASRLYLEYRVQSILDEAEVFKKQENERRIREAETVPQRQEPPRSNSSSGDGGMGRFWSNLILWLFFLMLGLVFVAAI